MYRTHWCALSTTYSLVKCLLLSREQWQTIKKKKKKKKENAKRQTLAFFIYIQTPSKSNLIITYVILFNKAN